MRFTNTRWCVGQVEPVRVSTTVDTGIILRGLLCLVQVEAYVRTDVLHPERSFYSCGLSDYSLRTDPNVAVVFGQLT